MGDSMARQHRPIAPSDIRRDSDIQPTGSVILEQRDPRAAKPKRAVVHVACLACRKLRIKCDGQRPLCIPCSKREELCEYDVEANTTRTNALKRKNESLESELAQYKELYRSIRQRPEYEAAEVFRRVRVTEDPLEVLRQLTAANLLMDGVRRINSEEIHEDGMSDGHEELRKGNINSPENSPHFMSDSAHEEARRGKSSERPL